MNRRFSKSLHVQARILRFPNSLPRSSSATHLVALGLFAVFQFSTFAALAAPAGVPVVTAQPIPPAELQPRLERGKALYIRNCFVCHQFNGQGIPGTFPPLAKSDLLTTNLERAIKA